MLSDVELTRLYHSFEPKKDIADVSYVIERARRIAKAQREDTLKEVTENIEKYCKGYEGDPIRYLITSVFWRNLKQGRLE